MTAEFTFSICLLNRTLLVWALTLLHWGIPSELVGHRFWGLLRGVHLPWLWTVTIQATGGISGTLRWQKSEFLLSLPDQGCVSFLAFGCQSSLFSGLYTETRVFHPRLRSPLSLPQYWSSVLSVTAPHFLGSLTWRQLVVGCQSLQSWETNPLIRL